MNTCKQCQKETKNPKFCSRSCSQIFNNKGVQRNKPKKRICKNCKEVFYRKNNNRSLRCEICMPDYSEESGENGKVKYENYIKNANKAKTIKEYRESLAVKGKHSSWTHAHVRCFNRSWNKELTSLPCANCGYDKHVELCHKKDIASFPDDTTLGEVNHPDNIVQLCRNCHWEFDNGILKL